MDYCFIYEEDAKYKLISITQFPICSSCTNYLVLIIHQQEMLISSSALKQSISCSIVFWVANWGFKYCVRDVF